MPCCLHLSDIPDLYLQLSGAQLALERELHQSKEWLEGVTQQATGEQMEAPCILSGATCVGPSCTQTYSDNAHAIS